MSGRDEAKKPLWEFVEDFVKGVCVKVCLDDCIHPLLSEMWADVNEVVRVS